MTPGTRLGHYEIVGLLGKGGMGEVYRAHDTKLGRDVALKILPAAFANDPDRMARFEREAKVLASLNHPNIAAIYGVEDRTLVMELVEGETLHGPLSLDDALPLARQIAAGLEYAHEKGVVHRDLKPANVKVTPEGIVKVLDFGLAKAIDDRPAPGDLSNSPTLTMGATQAGVILGTAAYMAPEQARGKIVDKRADIWAFGVVLYEMLTNERLFKGEDITETLASVVMKEPDLTRAPVRVHRLLKACLEKNPRDRLRDIGDAWRLLETLPDPRDEPEGITLRHWTAWVAAGALALAAAWGVWNWRTTPAPAALTLLRFNDDLGAELAANSAAGPAVAISPDGKRLVFVSQNSEDQKAQGQNAQGMTHLSLRSLGSSKAVELAGTDGAAGPFFSADSQWIAFFADGKLKKISVEGGAAVTLCDVGGNPRGGSWGEDNNILFSIQRSPLLRVPSTGGTPQPATELDQQKGEVSNRHGQLLPGGEAFLFTASRDNNVWDDANVQVQSLKTGKRKTLVEAAYFGRYIPGSDGAGYLIYVHEGTLFAAPMDLKRLERTGPGAPVLEDVASRASNGLAQLSVTPSGTLVYIPGAATAAQLSLFLADAAGNMQLLPAATGLYQNPRVSPDGTRMAIREAKGSAINLAVYEWAQNRMTQLTFLKGTVGDFSTWTPDGKHIAFSMRSEELSGPGIYWMRADGAGEPQRLLEGQLWEPYSFSPDGKRLAYYHSSPDYGIWTLPLDLSDPEHPKAGKPELFYKSNSDLRYPAFSPDSRWIAYVEDQSGRFELFVRPFPDAAKGRWQISRDVGSLPSWSPNRQELQFLGANTFWTTTYKVASDAFVAGQLRPWSEKRLNSSTAPELMPDGKHVVVVVPTTAATPAEKQTHVTFLLNFADELKRRLSSAPK